MSETTDQTENQDLVLGEDLKKDKREFVLQHEGGYCPFCGDTRIYIENRGEKDFDPEEDWYVCDNCYGQWLQIYERRLVDIDMDEQDYFWTKENLRKWSEGKTCPDCYGEKGGWKPCEKCDGTGKRLLNHDERRDAHKAPGGWGMKQMKRFWKNQMKKKKRILHNKKNKRTINHNERR